MESYIVEILPQAAKQLKKLNESLRDKILTEIFKMAKDPIGNRQIKKLVNTEYYRLRVNDYRVIFERKDEVLTILVIKVKHRKEVYK